MVYLQKYIFFWCFSLASMILLMTYLVLLIHPLFAAFWRRVHRKASLSQSASYLRWSCWSFLYFASISLNDPWGYESLFCMMKLVFSSKTTLQYLKNNLYSVSGKISFKIQINFSNIEFPYSPFVYLLQCHLHIKAPALRRFHEGQRSGQQYHPNLFLHLCQPRNPKAA